MSSISLIWERVGRHPADVLIGKMVAAQQPSGSDRSVVWSDRSFAVGASLSSSLPEDQFDRQPIWSPDRSACLVADVRLDNRADLARDLGLTQPEQLSDSAFLMEAWLRWGPACLDHMVGGFAFAAWMPSRKEIFAARDHAGERPLFYHRGEDLFALASMPKSLLALPGLHPEIVDSYTASWLASLKPKWDETFFQGIRRLPPGHWLRMTPQSLEVKQYWHPSGAKPIRFRRDEDYAEALVEVLDRATKARLRSVRPVGSFLSAGLDSSSVTASAAGLLAAEGKPLTAFTSVPRADFHGSAPTGYFPSEAEGAAETAARYPNIQHVLVDARGYQLLPTMKRWIDAMDGPAPAVVNLLWLTAIFDQARERGLGVMLEGGGGNATISYSTWGVLRRYMRRGRWFRLARTVQKLRADGSLGLGSAARLSAGGIIPRWVTRKRVPAAELRALVTCLASPHFVERYGLQKRTFDYFYPPPANLVEEHSSLFDGFDNGPFRVAARVVSGIELRDPTADKRVYEFSFAIPPEQFLLGGQTRSLVRRAMKDRLPPSVLLCKRRGLQGADWYLRMGEILPELRRELTLIEQSEQARKALDVKAMAELLDQWPESDFEAYAVYTKWHYWLARAFSMGYFLRNHEAVTHDCAAMPPL